MVTKKKVIASIAVVATVVTMGVGATLAYFTDKDTETITYTMGNVQGQINYTYDEEAANKKYMPGDEVYNMEPAAELIGTSKDAYVRVKISYDDAIKLGEGFVYDQDGVIKNVDDHMDYVKAQIDQVISDNMDSSCWFKSGDYWYCNKKLTSEDKSCSFFTGKTCKIPVEWNNAMRDVEVTFTVTAEFIQADNFIPVSNGTMITGWSENGVATDPVILKYSDAE